MLHGARRSTEHVAPLWPEREVNTIYHPSSTYLSPRTQACGWAAASPIYHRAKAWCILNKSPVQFFHQLRTIISCLLHATARRCFITLKTSLLHSSTMRHILQSRSLLALHRTRSVSHSHTQSCSKWRWATVNILRLPPPPAVTSAGGPDSADNMWEG